MLTEEQRKCCGFNNMMHHDTMHELYVFSNYNGKCPYRTRDITFLDINAFGYLTKVISTQLENNLIRRIFFKARANPKICALSKKKVTI